MNPIVAFVDDEPAVLDGFRRALRKNAKTWTPRFYSDPQEALVELAKDPADVVVTDLSMPGMTGLDLLERLKSECPGTLTIMLTGTAGVNDASAAINDAGVFRFYTKPCETADLFAGVEAALDSRTESSGSELGSVILDRLALAVVVIDGKGKLTYSNESGAALLQKKHVLTTNSEGVVRGRQAKDTDALKAALLRLRDQENSEDDTVAFSLEPGDYGRPLSVIVSPLERTEDRYVLFVSDPDTSPVPTAEKIATLYGLTPSESRLAFQLASGLDLAEAAEAVSLTVSSARTYLKQIFLKTETGRQSELIRLLLSAPRVASTPRP